MSLFVDDKDVDSRKGGTVLCKGPQVHVSISVLNRVVLLLRRVFCQGDVVTGRSIVGNLIMFLRMSWVLGDHP
jgi:hypothetical protein